MERLFAFLLFVFITSQSLVLAQDPAEVQRKPLFDVRSYGAKGDGITYDTRAIQQAIDACAGTRGTVFLSKGTFLTAQLTLRGHMRFFVDKDAKLLGGTEAGDYPVLVPSMDAGSANQRSLLYADQADGLILEGFGLIDGQGPWVKMNGQETQRPSLLRIFRSSNVIVRNLSFVRPRMWTLVFRECKNLTIQHIMVNAPTGYCQNLDGIDVCDSSDVMIRDCQINSDDDSISLKSHKQIGLHNITIRDNVVQSSAANAIKLGSATRGPVSQIRILNNYIFGAHMAGLDLESVDGSHVSDIIVSNLYLHEAVQPIFIRIGQRSGPLGSINNVTIDGVFVDGKITNKWQACTITGTAAAHVGRIVIKNASLLMRGGLNTVPKLLPVLNEPNPDFQLFKASPASCFLVRYTDQVVFDNVEIATYQPDARPWLVSTDAAVRQINCRNRGVL